MKTVRATGQGRQFGNKVRGVEIEMVQTCAKEGCWAHRKQDAEDGVAIHEKKS